MKKIEKVKSFIESDIYVPMTRGELMTVLEVPEDDKAEFTEVLNELLKSGTIIETKKRKFISAKSNGFVKAVFQGTGKGYGFAVTEEGDDFFIPPDDTGGAIDGDEILIKRSSGSREDRRGEAAVARVLKRAHEKLVGIYHRKNFYGTFTPDNQKIGCDFLIAEEDDGGALDGQKVVIIIERYPSKEKSAVGRVCEILGFPTDFGVDVLSVIKAYGFETQFPAEALKEADSLPDAVTDMSGRLDLTDKIIFTIDGSDTKDIDDAVSIEKNGSLWRLGVHIADVSHYVKPYSALDEEALKRGTSVYPPGMVIPMLPPKLSNGICSLNEGVLRYAVSVFMDIDEKGEVKSYSFAESVIKSYAKMTYDDVYLLMTGEAENDLRERYSAVLPSIEQMRELFCVLKSAAHERGNIDFDMPEANILLNDDGEAENILLRERNEAHMMIEEFMVITNATVAEHMTKCGLPAVFRVHEAPDGEKLETFIGFVQSLGYNAPQGALTPGKLQSFLESVKDEKVFPIISSVALRCMQKAKYSNENLGHYGLALGFYTHFTSPIRRYPDLMFHRALKAAIDNDKKTLAYVKREGKRIAEISSGRELDAERAERDVKDIKKAQYMEKHVGESFDGVISSVTRFGFFVMLPNTVEGLVRIENLSGGRYEFDEKRLIISGGKNTYRIGDSITVRLAAADRTQGRIDFIPEGMDYGKESNEAHSAKQESVSRVFHRRKNRGGHRAVRHRGQKRKTGKGKS